MLCPYCNVDKPIHATVCYACRSEVTITQHLIYSTLFSLGQIYYAVAFFGSMWLYDKIVEFFK